MITIGFLINEEEAVIWRGPILIDVRREMLMFQRLNIPLIENTNYLDISTSNDQIDIFGRGDSKKMADKFNVPFLGEIPIDPDIRISGNTGNPIVESKPDSTASKAFFSIAD